jgi:hypothetical protein
MFSWRIDHKEQCALCHADDGEAVFAVCFAVVEPFDSEHVLEHRASGFEADAVLGLVFGSLVFVPLNFIVIHAGTV